MEVKKKKKRIRFESMLVWRKIGFRGLFSTRDTHTEHVSTPKRKKKKNNNKKKRSTLGKINSLMVYTFYSSVKD